MPLEKEGRRAGGSARPGSGELVVEEVEEGGE